MQEMDGKTQAVYYRDSKGVEPVNTFQETLEKRAIAKIDDHVDHYLNGKPANEPPPEYPITSQVDKELRELRVRFADTRYRMLYQRSDNLIVLLHLVEKNTQKLPATDIQLAQKRFRDFRVRMGAEPRVPPRAAGRDAPLKNRGR
jgi:phage-related protein